MPSPFPGMDPFLEHPFFFPDLHASLIYCIRQSLQRLLPAPYYAVLNERLWVELSDRQIEPDVDVLHEGPAQPLESSALSATATIDLAQPILIPITHDERRETFVEIVTRTDLNERIVTTIELLSLTNKTPGEHGRELYLRKQKEVIDAKINLVEIDLLRDGEHTTALPPRKLRRKAGPYDYHICVAGADDCTKRRAYPIRMVDRLPKIEIPLLLGDPGVKLDLQGAFDRAYEDGPFQRRVHYELDRIVPPLTAAQAAWAAQRLAERK
jgi:hypothetical protein